MSGEHLSDDLIQEFLDRRTILPIEARRHLQECGRCREALEAYHELFMSLDAVRIPELAPHFSDRVMAQVAVARTVSKRSRVAVPQWLWIGATVVGVVAASALAMGPSACQNLLAQFNGIWSSSVSGAQTDLSKYLTELNLKPLTAVLSMLTLGGIILMDRLLVHVRRSRRLMSLMV